MDKKNSYQATLNDKALTQFENESCIECSSIKLVQEQSYIKIVQ